MGPPPSHEIPRASWYSGYTPDILFFRVQGFNLLWLTFPGHSAKTLYLYECPYPDCSVWALPASLAATRGIEFSFSSSGYLDVSVPRVASLKLWIGFKVAGHNSGRVVLFGYLRVKVCLRLNVAFRSLPRPSSAPGA